jgi:NAD(P)-dependent dehydrogenase (short-subunit alcohol dehydrogenase family)
VGAWSVGWRQVRAGVPGLGLALGGRAARPRLGSAARTSVWSGGPHWFGAQGVNVTAVHPGTTVTERTPVMVARPAERRHGGDTAATRRRHGGDTAATRRRHRGGGGALARGVSIGRLVTAAEVADMW